MDDEFSHNSDMALTSHYDEHDQVIAVGTL